MPRLADLDEILVRRGRGGVALACSGGVDSSFLKWRLESLAAVPFVCVQIETPVLSVPEVAANARLRCYHCKKALIAAVRREGAQRGCAVVMDGTNADDVQTDRPGLRALAEEGVVSPLAEAGVGKALLRAWARAAQLPFADAPSSPCLATRFPYGTPLTREALARVAQAEALVRAVVPPSADVRVRCEGTRARLELSPDAQPAARAHWNELAPRLAALGFAAVELDPRGYRSGSYDHI